MSTFRRIDGLLDGKTSDELAREVAARRERASKINVVAGESQPRAVVGSRGANRTPARSAPASLDPRAPSHMLRDKLDRNVDDDPPD